MTAKSIRLKAPLDLIITNSIYLYFTEFHSLTFGIVDKVPSAGENGITQIL